MESGLEWTLLTKFGTAKNSNIYYVNKLSVVSTRSPLPICRHRSLLWRRHPTVSFHRSLRCMWFTMFSLFVIRIGDFVALPLSVAVMRWDVRVLVCLNNVSLIQIVSVITAWFSKILVRQTDNNSKNTAVWAFVLLASFY